MKILNTLPFFLLPFFLFSQSIPQEKLVEYAKTAYHQKELAFGQKMSDLKTKESLYFTNEEDTLLLLMSFEENGFILLSAEEAAYPILAYSLEDNFDADNMPPGMRFFIEEYKTEIKTIKKEQIAPDAKTVQAWQDIKEQKFETSKSTIQPYLITAKWNQNAYYNQYSPVDADSPSGYDYRVPNGCVAVAMAMIMYYYRFPETGTGSHTNYSSYGNFYVDFAQQNYNYYTMTDELSYYNNEVAKLIFHCATSVNMMYGADGSGAYSTDVPYAMRTYFKYDNTIQQKSRANNSSQWVNILKAEIDNQRPVYYSGHNSDGGHAFVCDGYDNSSLFHFNFGWGGSGDGYFKVDNSNEAAGSFSGGQSAVTGIYPTGTYPRYCTGERVFTNSTGSIEDGSSSQNYQNDTHCTYILSPGNASTFLINLQYIETEENADSLSFWNGDPENGGELLLSLSGSLTNQTYYFDAEKLYIVFTTNEENTAAGWRLTYSTFSEDNRQCFNFLSREVSGTIEDGSNENPYAPNLRCTWSIRPDPREDTDYILLTFTDFDLSPEDRIVIYDYYQNSLPEFLILHGDDNPGTIRCNTNGIKIVLKTDNWLEKGGFKMEWRTNLSTAVEEEKIEDRILVFPNPAEQQFNIQLPASIYGNWQATLFDVTGRVVMAETISVQDGALHTMNIEQIPAGFYWIRLQSETEGFTKKIVVQK